MSIQILELEVGKEYSFVGEEQKYVYVENFGKTSYRFMQSLPKEEEIKEIVVITIPCSGVESEIDNWIKLNERAWILPCKYNSNEREILDREEFSRLKKILEEKK